MTIPIIILALLQVSGPDGGEQVAAIHTPSPMAVAGRNAAPIQPKSQADSVPVTQHVAKPDTSPQKPAFGELSERIQKRQAEIGPLSGSSEYAATEMDSPAPRGTGRFVQQGTTTTLRPEEYLSYSTLVGDTIEINTARVEPVKSIYISAGIAGKLTRLRVHQRDPVSGELLFDANGEPVTIEVKEGQQVFAGQEIGTIDDSVELNRIEMTEAMLEVARAEQEKKIEIEYAEAAWAVATAEVAKNDEMNRKIAGTVSDQIVLEAKLKKYQAKKQWEKSRYDLLDIRPRETIVKEKELAIAKSMLEQRRLVSPVNGIVTVLAGHEGEWFREGDKILQITQYDPLRIKGRVSINHAMPQMLHGKSVTITVPAVGPQPEMQFEGKVDVAFQDIEGDEHFPIFVEVRNKLDNGYWRLNPGRFVNMKIQL